MMESKAAQEKDVVPPENDPVSSELHEPIWSLVSFEKCIKSNLTYDEAVKEMDRLIPQKVPGLCIITDQAAGKL